MLRVALRAHLGGALALAAFFGVYAVIEVGGYQQVNATAIDRQNFALVAEGLGRSVSYLVRLPERADTLGGYLEWFYLGFVPAFFSVWALLAGTGAARGDEERGLVEHWLGLGVGRRRLLWTRLAAFSIALAAALAVIDAALVALAAAIHHPLDPVSVVLESISQAEPAVVVFAAGLLLGQLFATRRAAAGAGGAAVFGLFLLNGFARSVSWLGPYRWITPFAYADRSNALVPGGHADALGMTVLAAAACLLTAVASHLAERRDVGEAVLSARAAGGPRHDFASSPVATAPVLWRLWDQRVGLSLWSVAIGLYALSSVPLARPVVDGLMHTTTGFSTTMVKYEFGIEPAHPLVSYVGTTWFHVLCLLMGAYAITQVARWAGEDGDGRLEWMLASGMARWRVALERALALTGGLLVIGAANVAGVEAGSASADIGVGVGPSLEATLLVLPYALAFAGVGAALAAWRPRVAVGVVGGLLAISYMLPFMATALFKNPPDWFLNLSALHLYGAPLTDGVYGFGLSVLVAVAALGFASALLALQRRDVGS